MTFSESASFIGSQALANYLIDDNLISNIKSVWIGAAVLATLAIGYVTRGWQEAPQTAALKDYRVSFHRHVVSGTLDSSLPVYRICSCLQALRPFKRNLLPLAISSAFSAGNLI